MTTYEDLLQQLADDLGMQTDPEVLLRIAHRLRALTERAFGLIALEARPDDDDFVPMDQIVLAETLDLSSLADAFCLVEKWDFKVNRVLVPDTAKFRKTCSDFMSEGKLWYTPIIENREMPENEVWILSDNPYALAWQKKAVLRWGVVEAIQVTPA